MNDIDPSNAADLDELVRCLLQLHIRADKPSFRTLEDRTRHANGALPGTTVSRIPLRRSTLSDVLQGNAFPRKAFLLTLVEACGVNLETDRRWGQAWDRLAEAREEANETAAAETQQQPEDIRKQLTAAEKRAIAQAETPDAKDAVGAGEAGPLRADQKPRPVTASAQLIADVSDSVIRQAKVTKKTGGDGKPRLFRLMMDVVRVAHSVSDENVKAAALARLALAVANTDPDRAERIVESIRDEAEKAEALARLAQAVAVVEPDRADRLTKAAEDVASSASPTLKDKAWAAIGQVTLSTDPDRTERIAESIIDGPAWTAWLLASVAQKIGNSDPDRARSLISRAERVARSITDAPNRANVLCRIAQAAADTDPYLAAWLITDSVGVAQLIVPRPSTSYRIPGGTSIDPGQEKAKILGGIARTTATIDPDYAERIAKSITSEDEKGDAQVKIVAAVVRADPDRAERIAETITGEKWRAVASVRIARAVADTDPDRAERIAEWITSEDHKGDALAGVAMAVAGTDPERAERIAEAIICEDCKVMAMASIARAVANSDPDRAERLVVTAEEIARSIASDAERCSALAALALAVVEIDPDRTERLAATAEQIAWSIASDTERGSVLSGLALAVAALFQAVLPS